MGYNNNVVYDNEVLENRIADILEGSFNEEI